MKLKGICSYCSGLADETCMLCGALACSEHITDGVCANCRRGKIMSSRKRTPARTKSF